MKVNQQNPMKSSKSVSFSVMETIQKQGDSIDKLTSLMNELSSKLDGKENTAQYKPRIHQGRNRGQGQRQNRYGSRDRPYGREQGLYNSGRSRRSYQNSNNYGNRSYRPRNWEYQTNNRYNDRANYRWESFNQDYGQRNRNRSVIRECDRHRPRYRSTSRNNSVNIEITKVGVETEDKGLEQIQETGGIDQGLDLAPVLTQIGTGQDAIGAKNMTTSLENALMLCQMKNRMLFCSC